MMLCPECGKDSMVIDSRATPNGSVRRRRRCLDKKCAIRWTTYETSKEAIIAKSHADRRSLVAARNLLNKLLGQS